MEFFFFTLQIYSKYFVTLYLLSDENFYYIAYKDGYIIGNDTKILHNGLKNLNLVDCVIPRTFNHKKLYGYRCFHSAPSIIRAFIPNTITSFQGDTFSCCYTLRELIFEDGFHNINLNGYTLFGVNISSFKFPIGSKIGGYFFAESSIENIYIHDFMISINDNIFNNCQQTINIYVPANYPYDNFGGRPVKKILPNYYFRSESKGIDICLNNQLFYVISFVFLLL